MPKRNNSFKPPLSTAELKALYRQNPTPEHARTLWEVDRLKRRMRYFLDEYIKLMAMWPRNSGGRPCLLEILKGEMTQELNENWPAARVVEQPLSFTKGTMFEDLEPDHPEDLYLIRQWERLHGRKFEE